VQERIFVSIWRPVVDDFSGVCPRCGKSSSRPTTQKNNFDDVDTQGDPSPGASHVTTTRSYLCDPCGHQWTETIPHPRQRVSP
jgi:rubredoxin